MADQPEDQKPNRNVFLSPDKIEGILRDKLEEIAPGAHSRVMEQVFSGTQPAGLSLVGGESNDPPIGTAQNAADVAMRVKVTEVRAYEDLVAYAQFNARETKESTELYVQRMLNDMLDNSHEWSGSNWREEIRDLVKKAWPNARS